MQTIIGASIASVIMYAAHNWKSTDQRKIEHIFKNINYKVKDRTPKLKRRTKRETYFEYVYSVPYGLVDDPKLQSVIEKTLNKPVEVKFAGKLIINVFHERLPKRLDYDWKNTDPWIVPLGVSYKKMIYHNFDHIPHMTIAGMTRQGKTVMLKLILSHLISNNPSVEFYILDLKGGLEFGQYEHLKQVKKVTSTISESTMILKSINSRINTDMNSFKAKGCNNIVNTNIKRRTFVLVDEGAELDADCQKELSKIARIGGALGYRLIFATQYPTADTLPRQVKQNADAKISFRLPTVTGSQVAIDENGAEEIDNIGRAIYRTHEKQIIQVPYIKDNEVMDRLRRFEKNDTTKKEREEGGEDTITFG